MKRKRRNILLNKLSQDSALDLTAMVNELCDKSINPQGEPEIALRWSRRFAASGKGLCTPAPRIRL